MGVPVIATDLQTFRAHFDDARSATCRKRSVGPGRRDRGPRPGPSGRCGSGGGGLAPGAPYAWAIQKDRYLAIVGELVARGRLGAPSGA